jgi:hypothetical protein
MSFDFSVGDFLAAGLLTQSLIASLSSSFLSSWSSCQELVRELHVLKNGLDGIERLRGTGFLVVSIMTYDHTKRGCLVKHEARHHERRSRGGIRQP